MPYYSAATNGMYFDHTHHQIPMDRMEITDAQHRELVLATHQGKVIQADENGFPIAVDPKPQPKTPQQQIATLEAAITPRRIRDFLLDQEETKGWLKGQEDQIAQFRTKLKAK